MYRSFRSRKWWPLQLVFGCLVFWLAESFLVDDGDATELAYAAARALQDQSDRTPVVIERPPTRFIRDPNPAFAAVAVNSENDMLVVADENLFQILEYPHQENTATQARFSEPRRVISGTSTRAEMMCGVYIDPETLEIYALNNDTQGWIPVFAPDQRGDATPVRYIAGIRGFSITAHEERNELFVVNQEGGRYGAPDGQGGAVYVFRKQAAGEERPLRILEGYDTQLEDPHGIALDIENNLMYISNFGNVHRQDPETGRVYGDYEPASITVYPLDASGNSEPIRIIEGANTLLNWPSHMAFHHERQELFVANDGDSSVLVFDASAEGNAAPIRVLKGPRTEIIHPPGIAIDERNDELFVANMGTPKVTVFPVTADGDVAPMRVVRGAPEGSESLMIGNPGAVGYDTLRGEILVPN